MRRAAKMKIIVYFDDCTNIVRKCIKADNFLFLLHQFNFVVICSCAYFIRTEFLFLFVYENEVKENRSSDNTNRSAVSLTNQITPQENSRESYVLLNGYNINASVYILFLSFSCMYFLSLTLNLWTVSLNKKNEMNF